MKRFKVLVFIVCAVFLTPWIHHLAYRNIMLAIPSMDPGGAHFAAIALSIISPFVAAMLVDSDML